MILETERLVLRPHTIADFEGCLALWRDPGVVAAITGRAATEEDVWTRVLRYIGHWAALGYGYWAFIEKATGDYVGQGGFADFKREMHPPLETPESGWALRDSAAGKGYATEAMGAALAFADAHFEGGTCCIIDPDNAPSLRVAAKLGYREALRTTYKDKPTLVFTRPTPAANPRSNRPHPPGRR